MDERRVAVGITTLQHQKRAAIPGQDPMLVHPLRPFHGDTILHYLEASQAAGSSASGTVWMSATFQSSPMRRKTIDVGAVSVC